MTRKEKIAKQMRREARKAEKKKALEVAKVNTVRVQEQLNAYAAKLEPYWNMVKYNIHCYIDVDIINKKVSDVKYNLLGFGDDVSVKDKEYILTLNAGVKSMYLDSDNILQNAMPIQSEYDDEGNTTFARFIGFPGDGEKAIYKVKELLENAEDMLHEFYHLNFVLTD